MRLAVLLMVLPLWAACNNARRPATVPLRDDRILFSHARHARAEVDCATCHEDVYEATDLSADHRPRESVCLDCHQEKKDTGECAFCHSDPRAPATYVPRYVTLKVDHAAHLELVDEECSRCHTSLPEPRALPRGTTAMDACTSCHNHEKEVTAGSCDGCHTDLTRMPLRPITDYAHVAGWLQAHGTDARTSPSTCGQCHDAQFCSECHSGTVAMTIERLHGERADRAFIHDGDFLARHAVDAAMQGDTCLRCHSTSSCEDCHRASGLTELSRNPRSPHPPGWVTAFGPSGHGRAARLEIASCAGCHDQGAQSVCVDCHRVGGSGGNPHPLSWTAQHDLSEISRDGMCSFCHL